MSRLDDAGVGTKIVGYSAVGIGLAILFGAFMVLSYLVSGLVLSIMWKWFIVSTFGVPIISIPEAIGISMIMGLFTNSLATKHDVDDEDSRTHVFAMILARVFVTPFITLLLAWIVYQFV